MASLQPLRYPRSAVPIKSSAIDCLILMNVIDSRGNASPFDLLPSEGKGHTFESCRARKINAGAS
jgi:hypothetical protein